MARNNRLIPAGSLDTGQGRFSIKVPSVIEEARDLFDLPVRVDGDTVITMGDIATVRRTFKRPHQFRPGQRSTGDFPEYREALRRQHCRNGCGGEDPGR